MRCLRPVLHTDPLPSDEALFEAFIARHMIIDGSRTTTLPRSGDCRIRLKEYRPYLGRRVWIFGGGLGYFSRVARENGFDSLTFDPMYLPSEVQKGEWDTIVALHVLEHANDPLRMLRQMREIPCSRWQPDSGGSQFRIKRLPRTRDGWGWWRSRRWRM